MADGTFIPQSKAGFLSGWASIVSHPSGCYYASTDYFSLAQEYKASKVLTMEEAGEAILGYIEKIQAKRKETKVIKIVQLEDRI